MNLYQLYPVKVLSSNHECNQNHGAGLEMYTFQLNRFVTAADVVNLYNLKSGN